MTARTLFDKGEELKKSGDLPGALDAYRQSLKLNPRAAASWVGLADVLERNQQPGDALECLKRGAAAEPNNPVVMRRFARAFQGLGKIDDARKAFKRALQLQSGNASTLFGLGNLNEEEGRPQEAADCYRQVLKAEPGHAEALGAIVGLGKNVDVSAEIAAAQTAMAEAEPREKALIGYGLGRALEQLGQFDAAFETLAAANAARTKQAGAFQPKIFDRRVDQMIEIFSEDFFKARAGWGDASQTPVFVVGLPRSGTTLTEQIIGSHPDCYGAGELPLLTDLATGTPHRLGRNDPPWPQSALELAEAQVADIGRDYIRGVKALATQGAERIVDKQPLNFWHLGLIAIALPNAKIIHCRRDIRDNGLSIFSHNFNTDQRWATDLSDIAHYWRGYRRLMKHFQAVTRLNILHIDYEETVADLEGQARRLLEFLELPWDDGVLAFHENSRAVQTPSKWQVRQPLYASSKEKWRHYEASLRPLIEAASEASKAPS
ncbi:MAG: sulfotransferase [Pseudomonadota bacterium]